jgi:hypothetical protein
VTRHRRRVRAWLKRAALCAVLLALAFAFGHWLVFAIERGPGKGEF